MRRASPSKHLLFHRRSEFSVSGNTDKAVVKAVTVSRIQFFKRFIVLPL